MCIVMVVVIVVMVVVIVVLVLNNLHLPFLGNRSLGPIDSHPSTPR